MMVKDEYGEKDEVWLKTFVYSLQKKVGKCKMNFVGMRMRKC
jgi:hypothetical protein